MKKRKHRSVTASRAASRKAWRTRKKMRNRYLDSLSAEEWITLTPEKLARAISTPTIDRVPKVEWK